MNPNYGKAVATGGSNMVMGNQAISPESAITVGSELDMNEKRIHRLHEAIGQLENRLMSVLRPVGPSTLDKAPGEPPMPWSGVVCALRTSGYQVEAASARIEDLLNRLEV